MNPRRRGPGRESRPRHGAVSAPVQPPLIHICGELYRACVGAHGSPAKVIARAFRADRRLDDDARGFVADVVQGMLRSRAFVEAAVRHLADAREDDEVLLFLNARRGASAGGRGTDFARAIAAADRDTDGIDILVPAWLRRTLPDSRELLHAFSTTPPVTLRTNTLKATRAELERMLRDEGIDARPTRFSPWGLTLDQRANVFRTRAFREGLFEMQDEGSQLVALLCAMKPGDVVVDGCAGAGGKTLALAAMMRNKGTLYAFDTAAFRLEELRLRARRAGAHNLRIHAVKGNRGREITRLNGKAAVVLVDAPCSGTGVLRRNPDIGWKLTEDDVRHLIEEQARLLDAYAPLVKPGGRLVYATCSLLPGECAEQVARFLHDRPDFRKVDAATIFAGAGVASEEIVTRGDFSVDPVRHNTDGFYAAVLVSDLRPRT